jgi:site-specific DNA-methyltransferase (adenine-specific)
MTQELFLDGRVALHAGDCRDVLREFPDNHFDSVVTDPPYALVSITKRFGKEGSAPAKDVYGRGAAGFMGKQWDTGETAFAAEFWAEVYRVLKPGGHVAAFSGTRTYHRMACAIEDGGFEIRDQLAWTYGSGFPKSHNQPGGFGTALKPAWEPICLGRKPLIGTVAANLLEYGTGAINIDGCRVATEESLNGSGNKPLSYGGDNHRPYHDREPRGPTQQHALGRWPANVLHDGSPEVIAAFPSTGPSKSGGKSTGRNFGQEHDDDFTKDRPRTGHDDFGGSAARFFYCAKASKADRASSKHPTVKPIALMRWLCRLITPSGGLTLDPFAGSGTTGQAAWEEGFRAVLIEREAEYRVDIARRLEECGMGPDELTYSRATASSHSVQDGLPLFSETHH